MVDEILPAHGPWNAVADWAGALADISGSLSLLGWDRETAMPPGGAEGRAKLLGTLSALHHRELTRPDGDDLIAAAADDPIGPEGQRIVTLLRRERERATKVPEALVREISEAGSRCVSTWITTRPADDFPAFAETLEPLVALKRQEADLLCRDGGEPYDALLERFEPGARAAELEGVFARVADGIGELLAGIDRDPPVNGQQEWDPQRQMELARHLADLVGFDRDRGVIGQSAHPFTCTPHRGDVRFTTRVSAHEPVSNVLAVMHEAGHALYEQGFPDRFWRTPLFDAPSLGAHESQSRFVENHIGRTAAFWESLSDRLTELFPDAMRAGGVAPLHRAATRVEPSLIRVEADEVTYNLHIVLRFELELALIRGDLAVRDLPGAWADRMNDLLGVRPETDGTGCMQDIHWPEGMFGYFPTYTLGNLYAAMIERAMEAELGPIEPLIRTGDLEPVVTFLRERVHRHANLRDTGELMAAVTGGPLSEQPFLAHLRAAYDPRA